jgi:hypothetical protein
MTTTPTGPCAKCDVYGGCPEYCWCNGKPTPTPGEDVVRLREECKRLASEYGAACEKIHEAQGIYAQDGAVAYSLNRERALIAAIDRLASLAAGVSLVPQWQPIETAPKEGHFLVYLPEEQSKVQSARKNANGVFVIGGHFAFDMSKPTHWMLLPDAPALSPPIAE